MIATRFSRARALAVAAAVLAVASPAGAAQHKRQHAAAPVKAASPGTDSLGKSGAWTAYASGEGATRVCYVVGEPQKSEPGGFARKQPVAMVTHRPAEKIANVVSFVEGAILKDGSEVSLDVDGHKFDLFTKDDGAWARTSELDRTIVTALAKAKQAVVKGTPAKGPATTDVYALVGFAKALELIDKACGVTREAAAAAPAKPAVKHSGKSKSKHAAKPAPH